MIAVVCGLAILGIIEIFHLAVTTALVRRIRALQTGTAVAPGVGGPAVGERGPKPASLPGVPEDTDILVGFFSSGCPACRTEAPRFAEAVPVLRNAIGIRADSSGLHGKLATCYVRIGDKVAGRAELEKLRRLLPGISAQQYVNCYPCAFDSFKDALANSLAEIGMPA